MLRTCHRARLGRLAQPRGEHAGEHERIIAQARAARGRHQPPPPPPPALPPAAPHAAARPPPVRVLPPPGLAPAEADLQVAPADPGLQAIADVPPGLEARVAALEAQVAVLNEMLERALKGLDDSREANLAMLQRLSTLEDEEVASSADDVA